MTHPTLLQLLEHYTAFDETEATHWQRIIGFVKENADLYSRNHPLGHITASAVVTDRSCEHVLMIWHEKLQRWLQPGGHVEPELDESVAEAAARELEEETGLPFSAFRLETELPFDLDVHRIPARKNEAAHDHFDIRFLFTYLPDRELSAAYKWVTTNELLAFEQDSLSRFAAKIERRRGENNVLGLKLRTE